MAPSEAQSPSDSRLISPLLAPAPISDGNLPNPSRDLGGPNLRT